MGDYYSIPRVSHSRLEVFRRSVPEYAALYIAKTMREPEPSPDMQFGTMFDELLLEGKAPACKAEDKAKLILMVASVLADPDAEEIFKGNPERQKVILWNDAETGLPMKAKLDIFTEGGLVVDIKTARDPSPEGFGAACHRYGYHRQAATYLDAVKSLGHDDAAFAFLVVGKAAPHETLFGPLNAEALELGRRQNRELLRELADRMARQDWTSRHKGLREIALPAYAFR